MQPERAEQRNDEGRSAEQDGQTREPAHVTALVSSERKAPTGSMPLCGTRHVPVRAPIAANSVPELRRLATFDAAVVTESRQKRALSPDHDSDEPVHNRIRRTSRRLRCVAICLFRLLEPSI